MVNEVLLPALNDGKREVGMTYGKFQKSGASTVEQRAQIAKPTLLLTALDDPFHHPELCGFKTDTVESPNLIYMITEEGGHVSWANTSGKSPFMRKTIFDFTKACIKHKIE